MTDSTLLLPDSGPQFLRALNLAVLYSESVHVFTFTKPESANSIISEFQGFRRRLPEDSIIAKQIELLAKKERGNHPAKKFLKFPEEQHSLLQLAEQEGVIQSVAEFGFANLNDKGDEAFVFLETFFQILKQAKPKATPWAKKSKSIIETANRCPPSLFFLFESIIEPALKLGVLNRETPQSFREMINQDKNIPLVLAFGIYLLMASYYALMNCLTTVTWQPALQKYLDLSKDSLLSGSDSFNDLLLQRRTVKNRLGQLILEESVPNVADLPFEDVLDIRRKRHSEILAFRDGLHQLAADIDYTQDQKTIELALDTKIKTVFKPALSDLKNATAELQRNAYRRLFHPTKDMGLSLIPISISLTGNLPMDTGLMYGGAAGLIAKLYEFFVDKRVEKKNLLCASPWSLVFELQKK